MRLSAYFRHLSLLRILATGALLVVLKIILSKLYQDTQWISSQKVPFLSISSDTQESCPPEAWSTGRWTRRERPRTNKTRPKSVADVLEFEGFEGCTSDREHEWHFSGDRSQWFRFPEVTAYEWTPSQTCRARNFDRDSFVRDMVEKGGWLLLGDSVSENHYFSLSCLLYPHVRTTPNFTAIGYYEHHWPQDMYLNPASPLVHEIQFPEGFDIATTPLVSFRRSDLLLTKEELVAVHEKYHPERARTENFELFSDGFTINRQPSEYLTLFTAPLPEANYATLIASTAGHWTLSNFAGLSSPTLPHNGIFEVLELFEEAMTSWSSTVQAWLEEADVHGESHYGGGSVTMGGRKREVVVRAYLPGHDDCHNYFHPWEVYLQDRVVLPWNWAWIRSFNDLFKVVLQSPRYQNIHFVDIDRPGVLRPDAHVATDCLHIMSGAGVLEGWTQYIWHYITREIPG